jgi:hypothetical protein
VSLPGGGGRTTPDAARCRASACSCRACRVGSVYVGGGAEARAACSDRRLRSRRSAALDSGPPAERCGFKEWVLECSQGGRAYPIAGCALLRSTWLVRVWKAAKSQEASARLGLEVFAGWASPSFRGRVGWHVQLCVLLEFETLVTERRGRLGRCP